MSGDPPLELHGLWLVGNRYREVRGIEQDHVKAAQLYTQAAGPASRIKRAMPRPRWPRPRHLPLQFRRLALRRQMRQPQAFSARSPQVREFRLHQPGLLVRGPLVVPVGGYRCSLPNCLAASRTAKVRRRVDACP